MKISFINSLLVILVAGITLSVTSCNEDSIIKAGITPTTDNILSDNKIGDTLTILAKTIYDDSLNTSFTPSSFPVVHGVGTLFDPYAGNTNWGVYMQVIPSAANLTLPAAVDSAVLILPYAGFSWGDTSGTAYCNYRVYRVTDDLSKDSVYYSKQSKHYDFSNPMSVVTSVNMSSLKDSVKVSGSNRMPHMRIKLTDAFRDFLVNTAKNSGDNAAFLSVLKGLYIAAADTNNPEKVRRIPYFILNGSADYQRASIALYYSENGNTNPDNVKASFLSFVPTDCAHYNYISRRFSTNLSNLLNSTAKSDSIVILQNEPGGAIDIRIPHLKNLPVGIINKAQLVLTLVRQYGDSIEKYTEPARIYPVGIDASGKSYTILDREPLTSTAPLDFIDGNKRTVTLPNGQSAVQYYINIPREVQKAIVNKSDELHLRINGTITYPGAYRLIVGGTHSNSLYKIRLNIVYTKVN